MGKFERSISVILHRKNAVQENVLTNFGISTGQSIEDFFLYIGRKKKWTNYKKITSINYIFELEKVLRIVF